MTKLRHQVAHSVSRACSRVFLTDSNAICTRLSMAKLPIMSPGQQWNGGVGLYLPAQRSIQAPAFLHDQGAHNISRALLKSKCQKFQNVLSSWLAAPPSCDGSASWNLSS